MQKIVVKTTMLRAMCKKAYGSIYSCKVRSHQKAYLTSTENFQPAINRVLVLKKSTDSSSGSTKSKAYQRFLNFINRFFLWFKPDLEKYAPKVSSTNVVPKENKFQAIKKMENEKDDKEVKASSEDQLTMFDIEKMDEENLTKPKPDELKGGITENSEQASDVIYFPDNSKCETKAVTLNDQLKVDKEINPSEISDQTEQVNYTQDHKLIRPENSSLFPNLEQTLDQSEETANDKLTPEFTSPQERERFLDRTNFSLEGDFPEFTKDCHSDSETIQGKTSSQENDTGNRHGNSRVMDSTKHNLSSTKTRNESQNNKEGMIYKCEIINEIFEEEIKRIYHPTSLPTVLYEDESNTKCAKSFESVSKDKIWLKYWKTY